jgi:2-hydroxychromene-2-carboxylate isomerase
MNPKFPFNSITLLRMLVSLPSEEQIKFIEALSPAIWEDQLDVSDATALGAVLRQAGFDPDVLAVKAQDPAVKQLVIDNTDQAVARGCFGIPTFFVGKEMFFGKERLGQIEELLERE